jgi:TRAP-type C4-dicarboxylate transport system permease small subunit
MHALRSRLDRLLSAIIGAALLVIFFLNMYQVGGRYLYGIGAVWIPDLTRLLFIWMVFLGTALMHLRKRHLVIDYLLLKMPPTLRRGSQHAISAGMLAIAVVLIFAGWRIAQIRMDIPYTGLEISTGYAYFAVPVAAGLIAFVSLADLVDAWRRPNAEWRMRNAE